MNMHAPADQLALDDGYVLHRTEEEYHRLQFQGIVWQEVTRQILAKAELGPGMRVLDVGCGLGDVMRMMGRLVGPRGHVTGLDIDARLGAHVLGELQRDGGAEFSFVAGDILGDPVPGGPFDVVFARLLLIHAIDPVAMLERMAALVRPGGRIVVMDHDLTRMGATPDDKYIERCFSIFRGCFVRTGRLPDVGMRLPALFEAAGLPPPEGTEVSGFLAPMHIAGPMIRSALTSFLRTAVSKGVASAAEIAALQAYVSRREADNRQFCMFPPMIGCWTTLPPH